MYLIVLYLIVLYLIILYLRVEAERFALSIAGQVVNNYHPSGGAV